MTGSVLGVTYSYDQLNRLAQATYSDGTLIAYTYDAAGNRLTQTVTLAAPAIATPPQTQTAVAGNSATFTVAATGSGPLTYQWQLSTDGGSIWADLGASGIYSGANATTLTLSGLTTAMNGYQFRAIVSNGSSSIATSAAATLTVNSSNVAPAFSTQPVAQSVTAGGNSSFTAAVTGTPAPTLKWQVSTDNGTTWTDVPNASPYTGNTSATLTITAAPLGLNNYLYRCLASNVVQSSVASDAATLTVGKTAAAVTLSGLSVIYDGTPRSATATTSPSNLTVNFTYDGSSNPPTNAGSYMVTGTISDPNYTGSTTGTLVIGKAPLTARGSDASKLQGAANPALTISYSGFVNGETKAVLTSEPTPSTTANTTSPAGPYPITLSGGSAANYTLILQDGTLTVDAVAQFLQQGPKLVGTGAVGNAQQGYSVALSADGNTAIVGGSGDGGVAGAAWVWTRSGGAWTQQGAKLVGSGGPVVMVDQGLSVSLSADGNTAIVGGFTNGSLTAAAWAWTRSGGVWTQQATMLVGSGAVGVTSPAVSVSLSADGNAAIVGGGSDQPNGAAWVWTRSAGVWTQQGTKLVGSGAVGNAFQGGSVSISADGNTAIVGGNGDNGGAGAAWVWTRSAGAWTQQGTKLVGAGAIVSSTGAGQGTSVCLSADGNTAIVGGNNDTGTWVWARSGGVWTQQGSKLVPSDVPGFGYAGQGAAVSLSADGNTAIIGGPAYDNTSLTGAAWVWTRSGGVWTQQGTKLAGSGAVGAFVRQGASVALSADGTTAIIGGPGDNSQAGAAWVFANSTPVDFLPIIATQPETQVLAAGANANFTVAAIGTPVPTLQWQVSVDGSTWTDLASTGRYTGATTGTLNITGATTAMTGNRYRCVATNSAGSAASNAAVLTVNVPPIPAGTSAAQAVSTDGYIAGGTVTISNTLTYTGAVTGLSWQVLLPEGWSYASGGGSEGEVKPAVGDTGTLEWAWITLPASPVTFTYALAVPASTTGTRQVAAIAILQLGGQSIQLLVKPDPLIVNEGTPYHTADTNRDWKLSLLELARVIELYNTRNGTTRTGCYAVLDGSEDGFAPEPTRSGSSSATLPKYHSADTDRNGRLGLLELARVIELYNQRTGTVRTGQYHVQAGTEDGYAPGL